MIGGLIMTHSDDDGLVLPPKIAPDPGGDFADYPQRTGRQRSLEYCEKLKTALCATNLPS